LSDEPQFDFWEEARSAELENRDVRLKGANSIHYSQTTSNDQSYKMFENLSLTGYLAIGLFAAWLL
jgi:hypothetical protein